ncbi:hypothetical protein BJY54_006931 [Streptomyces nodosus]|nr:hypothetical protein [Streptomyces nodosus]
MSGVKIVSEVPTTRGNSSTKTAQWFLGWVTA